MLASLDETPLVTWIALGVAVVGWCRARHAERQVARLAAAVDDELRDEGETRRRNDVRLAGLLGTLEARVDRLEGPDARRAETFSLN